MIISQYNNFYTNQVSQKVADELIARIEALSALNRNVSDIGSSKQFYAVRDRSVSKPELLRKFQEWRDRKVAFAEVRAFRKRASCCNKKLVKQTQAAPFVVTVKYDDENGIVPVGNTNTNSKWNSYGDIKYSTDDGLNIPSTYKGQPQVFLESVNVINEGYAGVVKRITLKMRVFTKEAFEIVDTWFLRPGNEVLVKYGWSVPLTSIETATDVIHGVIFNFNASMDDNFGWSITVNAIAKGNLAVGVALGSQAEQEAIQSIQDQNTNTKIVPSLTNILKEEINRIKRYFPALATLDEEATYSSGDLDPDGNKSGIVYESDIFPHGIGRLKHSISNDFTENIVANTPEARYTPPASDEDFLAWVDTFRTQNPEFSALESRYGSLSATAFIEFYKNNFGLVSAEYYGEVTSGFGGTLIPGPGQRSEFVYPDRSNLNETEQFINNPNLFLNFKNQDRVPSLSENAQLRQEQLQKEKKRPPIGPIRRRVLDIMYTQLPDNRTEEAKLKENNLRSQALARDTEQTQDPSRITSASSVSRYYVCLGDLVYFFNEMVLRSAPELYESVQLLVENQPTSYDPEIVSAFPDKVIFSDVRSLFDRSMSSYDTDGSGVTYGFKYRVTTDNQFSLAVGCNGYDFYNSDTFLSKGDMDSHTSTYGIITDTGDLVSAYNIAHIWISIDIISQYYNSLLENRALDPQYKTLFDFFNEIFKIIAHASGNIIQLTLVPDNNTIYDNSSLEEKILSETNPILSRTHLYRIVDINYQLPDNLPSSPKAFDFKFNDVNRTLLRDVTVALKLPSKLQTVAYTFGRVGLNDDVVDIGDEQGICTDDYDSLINSRYNILEGLRFWKKTVALTTNEDTMYNLQNSLDLYRRNPAPNSNIAQDTSTTNVVHQAWIYSKLYPIELQLKLDGISGFLYGNKINILNALPSRYNNAVFFTITKIEHSVQNNDWITTITAIARLKNSNQTVQFPTLLQNNEDCDGSSVSTGPVLNVLRGGGSGGAGSTNVGIGNVNIPPNTL
jgi:hypothetical protein